MAEAASATVALTIFTDVFLLELNWPQGAQQWRGHMPAFQESTEFPQPSSPAPDRRYRPRAPSQRSRRNGSAAGEGIAHPPRDSVSGRAGRRQGPAPYRASIAPNRWHLRGISPKDSSGSPARPLL